MIKINRKAFGAIKFYILTVVLFVTGMSLLCIFYRRYSFEFHSQRKTIGLFLLTELSVNIIIILTVFGDVILIKHAVLFNILKSSGL